MKASFNIQGLEVTVSAIYKGDKKADWGNDPRTPENWNNHRVTVKTAHGRTSFEFWASIMHPTIDSENDLRGALDCFVSDALAGEDSFENFCNEFGYDSDSRKHLKIFKACERANAKLKGILGDTDLYDFANELRELENA